MMIKKMGIAATVFVMYASLPIQTSAMASENTPMYTMKAEQKIVDYSATNSLTNLKVQPAEVIKLVNGGFEEPDISSESRGYKMLDASEVPGWETTASDNQIEIQRGYGGVAAAEGKQYAEINANMVSALYQDVATKPGTKIRWKVSHRGRAGVDVAEVKFGAPDNLQVIATMSTGKEWKEYQGTYTIPEGQDITRFQFEAVSTSNGNKGSGNLLDNIVFSSPSNLIVSDAYSQPTVKKGKQVNYLVDVANNGGMVAGDVNLSIPLPKELEYIPDTVTINGVTTSDVLYDEASHSLTVNVASIPDDSTAKISIGLKGITETASATTSVATTYYDLGFTDHRYDANTANASIAVVANTAPTIAAVDKTVKKGINFDALAGVSASDQEDGNITSKVQVIASDVDVNKIGTYHVTYSVTDSDNNTTTKTITVTVTSNDAPTISATDKTLKKGGNFNPLTGVSASDLEDGDLTSAIKITANDVDTSKVGTYHITYSVTDSDGNTTTKTIAVTVTSNDAPVIDASNVTMRVHQAFNVKEAVTATDTEDGNLTNKIQVTASDVDIDKAGVYHVTYSVTDSDGNTTTKTITVTVLTNDAPILVTSDVYLKVGDKFDVLAGITASDLEDGNVTDKIIVLTNSVDMTKSGTYSVEYSVTDSDNNTTTIKRNVYVRTNDKPVIHASDQTFKAGATFDVMQGMSASDTEDGDITSKVSVTANDVNAMKAGTYHVTYSVTDSDNNTTNKTITITVLTNEKPVIEASDITQKAHRPLDPLAGVVASDLEDGDLTASIKVIANDVNIDVPGEYHITYSVLDSDGNMTEKTITVTILSNDPAIIYGQDSSFKAGSAFDPMAGITATDTEDGDLTANIQIVANDVNADVAGVYHVTYSITDSDGNVTEQTYTVTVLTNEKPVIHAVDQSLSYGQDFDPMAGVSAEDLEDGDLTAKITVVSNDVNTKVPGIYHVTYSVIDSDGNETQYTITVLVGAQPIAPVVPVVPVEPVKPVKPVIVTPTTPVKPVAPTTPDKVVKPVPTVNILPKTGDTDRTKTILFGGFLTALGALFLRRKK